MGSLRWPAGFFAFLGIVGMGFSLLPEEREVGDSRLETERAVLGDAVVRIPTYAEDIAPLLNENCVSCHRPGEVAPFSLVGYESAKRWAEMLAIVTEKGRMPPWKAVPGDFAFANDAHLSDDDKRMLRAWADAGAPRGDRAKEPAPPEFKSGWALGEPDIVWSMPYAHQISAEGDDEYWHFVIRPEITEPVWISAVDVRPGNKQIVHHVILFVDETGAGRRLAATQGDGKAGYRNGGGGPGFIPGSSLGGWAPGVRPVPLPPDSGFLLKPGADIVMQVHYNKSGKPETDLTQVGVYLNKGEPTREVEIAWIANPFIRIVPDKKGQTFTWRTSVPRDIRLYNLMPHMHLLGRSMKATVEYPDGRTATLVDVRDWDFNWQLVYTLKEPAILPAGSRITVVAEYDNTADNPFQPNDPPKLVTWGEETGDEMMLLVAAYSVVEPRPRNSGLNPVRPFGN